MCTTPPNEFKTPAALKYLEPLYTAPVPLDRIARDLLFDVKNRVNALVLLPSSERRESEIRIKQDIADFLAAPQAQEADSAGRDAEPLTPGTLERFAALVAAREREECALVCESEEARALYNFDNDLEANRPFWNGCSQAATSCAASIRARSTE